MRNSLGKRGCFITELSISVLLSNLIGLFALMGVGFAAVRTRVLPAQASAPMTSLLMKITLPATIFSSMFRPFDPSFLRDALTIFFIGLVFHLGYVGLAWALARIFRVPQARRGMWTMCCAFCNNGFMGFPVAYALFGEEGLALAAILGIAFNLLIYTIGAKLVAMDRPADVDAPPLSWGKVLCTPVNLSILLGLAAYCLQLSLPVALTTPIQHLANITTPLSMMVTGMNLAGSRLSDVVRDRDALTASGVRLLLIPLLTWVLLHPVPISNPLVMGVALVIMSMPSPAVSVVMAEEYGGCVELGARTVCLSSLFCIVTIPLMALLL